MSDKPVLNETSRKIADEVLAGAIAALPKDKAELTLDKSLYMDSLKKANLDPEVVKAVKEHDCSFLAAATHTIGEFVQDLHAKKDSPERIVVKVPTVNRDKLSLVFDKSTQSRNPRTGEVSTTYGVSAKWVVGMGSEFQGVKDSLRARAKTLKIG